MNKKIASIDTLEKFTNTKAGEVLSMYAGEQMKRYFTSLIIAVMIFAIQFELPIGFFGSVKFAPMIAEGVLLLPLLVVNNSFFVKGIPKLLRGKPNSNSLVALGTLASIAILRFDYAAGIMVVVNWGRFAETRIRQSRSLATEKINSVIPKTMKVERDSLRMVVPSDEIKVRDVMDVRAGSYLPVDGKVIEGTSLINMNIIAGEALPRHVNPGDEIPAGAYIMDADLKVEAKRDSMNSSLSKYLEFVDAATSTKARFSYMGSRISRIIAPCAIILAAMISAMLCAAGMQVQSAAIVGISLIMAVSPWSFRLFPAASIMAGTSIAAENGIVIKSAEILEQACKVETVLLDKTGTITDGHPEIMEVIRIDDEFDIGLAAAIEAGSSHPVARAIVKASDDRNDESRAYLRDAVYSEEYLSQGIKAYVDGKVYYAGNEAFVRRQGFEINFDEFYEYAQDGNILIYFIRRGDAGEDVPEGIVVMKDYPKPESAKAVSMLESMGINVALMTGDTQMSAETVLRQVCADEIYYQVLPEEKADIVDDVKHNHRGRVATAGSGRSDIEAMNRADISFAMGSADEEVKAAAEVVLIKDNLEDVARTIKLSELTMRNVRRHLAIAVIVNIIGVFAAVGSLLPAIAFMPNPIITSVIMCLSSLIISANTAVFRIRGID